MAGKPIFLTRSVRQVILIILFLLVLDVFLIHAVNDVRPDCQKAHYQYMMGEVFSQIDEINRGIDGVNVVFVGDSIIYGARNCDRVRTVAQNFQELSYPARVFDLSLKSSRTSDQYFIIKSIINRSDVIFFNVNYALFSKHNRADGDIIYKDLPYRLGYAPSDNKLLDLTGNETYKALSEKEKADIFFFENHPKLILEKKKSDIKCFFNSSSCTGEEPDNTPFQEFNESWQRILVSAHDQYFNVTIDSADVSYYYLRNITDVARSHNATVIAVILPLNKYADDKFQYLNRTSYKEFVRYVKEDLNNSVVVIDYSDVDLSEWMYDLIHFTDEGNRRIAEMLYADTATFLGRNND